MAFEVKFDPTAEKDLKKLSQTTCKRILKKLDWFASQPNPLEFAITLQGKTTGDARFRIGDYRIIFVVNKSKKLLYIVRIDHRREIYKHNI